MKKQLIANWDTLEILDNEIDYILENFDALKHFMEDKVNFDNIANKYYKYYELYKNSNGNIDNFINCLEDIDKFKNFARESLFLVYAMGINDSKFRLSFKQTRLCLLLCRRKKYGLET